MFDLTIITPTNDRPAGIALCERWMARQTFTGSVQWIVADGGAKAPPVTMGQTVISRKPVGETGSVNLARNLLAALDVAAGRYIAIVEDDDFYKPDHLATLVNRLDDGAMMAGECVQHYYNVQHRMYRRFDNVGASLCQTGMRREMIPMFRQQIEFCIERNSFGIDGSTWRVAMARGVSLALYSGLNHVIGIKGIPGTKGLGCGHRAKERPIGWASDPSGARLRELCGDDAAVYEEFYAPENLRDSQSRPVAGQV